MDKFKCFRYLRSETDTLMTAALRINGLICIVELYDTIECEKTFLKSYEVWADVTVLKTYGSAEMILLQ